MFTICTSNQGDKNWYVGEPKPDLKFADIYMVQVDGDELDYVMSNFYNIPLAANKRVQIWQGDFALFMANNL